MSNIRRQSIISSVVVYIGFALGFLNTYLFTREGGFSREEYGLTSTFIAVASIMYTISCVGMHAYIYKFYPYYKDNLQPKQNDQMSWALLISTTGFTLVLLLGWIFDGLIRDAFANQPMFLKYYYWIYPFGFGLTIFSILEAYGWQKQLSVLTNYMREVQFRLFVTVLIVLLTVGVIESFDGFIKLYAFIYIALALIMMAYLFITKKISFTFKVSKVTRRFFRKILLLVMFIWSGGLIFNLSYVFDTIILTSVLPDGLAAAGIFTLGQYMTSLIQAPQRGIIAASVGPLSQAWKDKDFDRIKRIYHRSSISQLLFALGMFMLIWMNFDDAILTLGIQEAFLSAKNIFLLMGIMRIIDMGTGVNQQIIGTSTFWRFDFITGMILLALTLPLNYFLTKELGLIGPAIANLVAFTIYNAIRYTFLLKRFKMQPFTSHHIYSLLLGIGSYIVCFLLFDAQTGLLWMFLRSACFLLLYGGGIILFDLSPDIKPVLTSLKKRMGAFLPPLRK